MVASSAFLHQNLCGAVTSTLKFSDLTYNPHHSPPTRQQNHHVVGAQYDGQKLAYPSAA